MEKVNQKLERSLIFFVKKLLVTLCLSTAFFLCVSFDAKAVSLIFDDETQELISNISRPLYKYSNIPFNANKVFIVNDPSLNAFVADGNNLFIHTGTIINAGNENELAGVIAHEIGHIKGGHILRMKLKSQSLQNASIASMVLATGLGALTGKGDVAMAVLLGSQSSVLTNFTRYRVEEERSADEYGLKALHGTNQSAKGMLSFMKKIEQKNQMSGVVETPYFRTHPITKDRIYFFENAVKDENYQTQKTLPFLLVKAKLFAYLNEPREVYSKYDNSTDYGKYAIAIAKFRELKFSQAVKNTQELIQKYPNSPYFYELLAEIYTEQANLPKAEEAYRKAISLKPNSSLFKLSLAHNLIEQEKDIDYVISILKQSIIAMPTSYSWQLLARAYGLKNDSANALYASAEYSYMIGNYETSVKQAQNALKVKKIDKNLKLRIEDLISRVDELIKNG